MKPIFLNVLVIGLLGSLLLGCGMAKKSDEWTLDGKLTQFKGGMVYLDRLYPEEVRRLDSTDLEEGNFAFRGVSEEGAVYQIRWGQEPGFPFMPENDALTFRADGTIKGSWRFEGNKASALLRDFVGERGRLYNLYKQDKNAMRLIPRATTLGRWREAEAKADHSLINYRNYVRGFIDTVSVPALRTYATFSMNPEANFFFLQELHGRMVEDMPDYAFTAFLGRQLESIGEPFLRWEAADVKGTALDGQEVSLRGQRGKLTLLYFWAGYCEFSRRENKLLQSLYEQYEGQGFTIFAVSIDDLDSEWRAACAADNLTWPANIRVDKSWNSPVFGDYSVQSIPTTFLLDSKGIIRSKNVRADELQEQLPALLQEWGPSSS